MTVQYLSPLRIRDSALLLHCAPSPPHSAVPYDAPPHATANRHQFLTPLYYESFVFVTNIFSLFFSVIFLDFFPMFFFSVFYSWPAFSSVFNPVSFIYFSSFLYVYILF